MSDELQAGAAPAEGEAEQQANTGTSDLAPGEAGENQGNNQSEKVEFTPEQQAVFDKAINRQHSKFRDSERAHEETQARLNKAEGRIGEFEASQPAPVIPPMPDSFDEDFDAKVTIRDAAIRADAEFKRDQSLVAQANENAANDRALAQQNQGIQYAQTLEANAVKLGIKQDDLNQASLAVGAYKLDPGLVVELMTHDDGPVMIAHLAANPLELDALRSLPLGQAFSMLHSTVLEGAQALKPKTSSAPPPPDVLSGNGAREEKNITSSGMRYTTK